MDGRTISMPASCLKRDEFQIHALLEECEDIIEDYKNILLLMKTSRDRMTITKLTIIVCLCPGDKYQQDSGDFKVLLGELRM